ncbi:box H/ACA snoRNP assembly protein Shq1 [Nadsonia fulvescens var. elongata DSM 6958]|uniref:Box H/ACA snoRNP assembly protein Shq1 n=1 Tax=Nadsonia fulvescens var. elongata DSM 6958 TaxID=857566 RepID=A0A1E3PP57_9ASCO|nr:box H/ACA snoRNP assembly protein Shq1 [Nadsonia fulvescens var. elongata DSM 6958]
MITPLFQVRQDDEFVYIDIKAPHIRAPNIEMVVDKDLFIFSLHPYYLRLRFPHKVLDDERANASYDLGKSTVAVKLPKENKGEEFEDLDMTSKLLARSTNVSEIGTSSAPLIEEMNQSEPEESMERRKEIFEQAEEFNWELPQDIPADPKLFFQANYGFDDKYNGIIGVSLSNGNDINEVYDIEKLKAEERKLQRIANENERFDIEYYLADLFDNPMIEEILEWKSPYTVEFLKWQKSLQVSSETPSSANVYPVKFSTEEQTKMTELPKKTYILTNPKYTYLNVISILFAYAYDNRTTNGDSSVESPWTIGKITPLFSCLDASQYTLAEIVKVCSRRALCFPLYRHWELIQKCWDDVYYILRQGKRGILRVLLKLRQIFGFHDVYYVYNKIWLDDYAIWIQYANDTVIRSLAHELRKFKVEKDDMEMDLVDYEELARESMQDQEQPEE